MRPASADAGRSQRGVQATGRRLPRGGSSARIPDAARRRPAEPRVSRPTRPPRRLRTGQRARSARRSQSAAPPASASVKRRPPAPAERAPRGAFASGSAAVAAAVALPLRPFIDREPAPRRAPRPATTARPAMARKAGAGVLRRVGAFVVVAARPSGCSTGVVRGRAWIPLLGVLLAGIVAAQVEILKLGASMGRSLEQTTTLTSQNEQLRDSVAALSDDQRIERLATQHGHGAAAAGSGRAICTAGRGGDVTGALANIHAPDAAAFMALTPVNGALVTGPGTSMLPTSSGVLAQAGTPGSATPTTHAERHLDGRPRRNDRTPPATTTGHRAPRPATSSDANRHRPSSQLPRRRAAAPGDDADHGDHGDHGGDDRPRTPRARPPARTPTHRPDSSRPARRPRPPAPRRSSRQAPPSRAPGDSAEWRVIDRRIGILFIVFVALLGIALARATYLGSVRAGSLERAAATQQVSNVVVPGAARRDHRPRRSRAGDQRVRRRHRRGPVPDQERGVGIRASSRRCLGSPAADGAEAADQAAHRVCLPRASGSGGAGHGDLGSANRRHHSDSADPPRVSARGRGRAGGRLGPPGRRRRERHRVPVQQRAARGRTGCAGSSTTRSVSRSRSTTCARPYPGKTVALTIDSGLQQEVERVLAEVGAEYSPKGATAIAVDPSTGAILALANWPASRRQARRHAARTRRSDSTTSRVRRSRRSRSPARSRTGWSRRTRSSTSRRSSSSRTGRSTTPRTTGTRR